jgi:hypothetical protein
MRVVEFGIGPLAIIPPALAAQDALIQAVHVKLYAQSQGRRPTGRFAITSAANSIAGHASTA